MKNLKKVFAVVIALSMILSTAAFAAVFSDVADNAAYTEAIELGASINLFTGYEDGSFKPEGDITRAEFAAIIVRMLGQEAQSSGAAGATKFADVPSTHWAAGYINIVTNLGIVNGYGDGNFGPEDNVTYEQAVKMCVVALGYEPAAAGNYPVGYLTIAQQRGVTTSVKGTSGVAINRGQVAQMAFNSLDVPLMTQTGFGTYIEYVINDGTNNTTRKTLLSENLDIVKIKAMVEQTYDLSSSKKESLVQVEVLNAYRSIYGDKGEKFEEDTKVSIDAGKTNLKSFVGYNVIAYVAYNDAYDDDPVALYVTKDISSADEITIAASDIEDIVKVGSTHYDVSYMASKDARSAEKFSVDAGARVYYNGQKDDRTLTTILNNFYGTATFALNDSRNTEYDYDTVYVLHYENAVVESVNLTAGRVSVKEGKVVYFGDNQPDSSATLYDVDGKELEWSELEENDVLSIRRTVGTNNRNVYVCTLVRNVVEGVITEKTSEDDAEFKIGGAYYKTDNGIVYPDDLDLQYEGVFYLDIFGRIAYYEAQSSLSSNYAFVIDADVHSSGFENRLSVKAFTFDGEVVIFTGATRISLVEEDSTGTKTKLTTYKSDGGDEATDTFGGLKAKIEAATVITFAVNSQGELSRIALPGSRFGEEGVNYFSEYTSGSAFNYRGNDGSIRAGNRSVEISKDTVIMIAGKIAPNSDFEDDDDYDLLSLSVLGIEDIDENFTTTVYDVNKNGIAGLIVVNGQINVAGAADGLAMVTNISTIRSKDGGTVDKLTVFQGGKSKEIEVLEGKDTPDLFSLVAPQLNAKGELTKFDLIASVTGKVIELGSGFANSSKIDYAFGGVTAIRNNRVTIDVGAGVTESYTVPSSANIYLYDGSMTTNARKAKIVDGMDLFDVEIRKVNGSDVIVYTDDRGASLDNVQVLIRRYDGKIQDVIVFFNTTTAVNGGDDDDDDNGDA